MLNHIFHWLFNNLIPILIDADIVKSSNLYIHGKATYQKKGFSSSFNVFNLLLSFIYTK